jgi:hypothetical protein
MIESLLPRTEAEAKFPLGTLALTSHAFTTLPFDDIAVALQRHVRGDWGDVCEADRAENERSLQIGQRLFSVYYDRNGAKFWIITEADRRSTTVLLPEDC